MAVKSAPDKAALTFWVYPDSFPLYRQLRDRLHARGFLVAAQCAFPEHYTSRDSPPSAYSPSPRSPIG